MKSPITTHVLDTARGCPAVGVPVVLEQRQESGSFVELGSGITDQNGRISDLISGKELKTGEYRLTFDTGTYFAAQSVTAFFLSVVVDFRLLETSEHYHVPLLLSPFGYSTYRGS